MVFIDNALLVIFCIILIYHSVNQVGWAFAVCSSHTNYVSLYYRVLLLLYQLVMQNEGDAQDFDDDRQITERLGQPEAICI